MTAESEQSTPASDPRPDAESGDQLNAPFGVLLEDCLRRTDRITEQLGEARREYSGRIEDRSYGVFIEALTTATERARAWIRVLRARFNDLQDPSREGELGELLSFSLNLDEYLERYINPLLGKRSEELDVFALPFTRLAKQLVPNVEVLFLIWNADGYRAEAYDYARFESFEPLAAKNVRLTYGRDIRFVLFWYPRMRDADVFEHAVFAHELGHIALAMPSNAWDYAVEEDDYEEGAEEDPVRWSPEPSIFETVLANVPPPQELSRGDRNRLTHWFQECACDVFAMRLIGPAFALAYAESTASNRPLEPTKQTDAERRFHPPAQLRFELLSQEMNRFSFGDFDDELRPKVHSYLQGSYFVGEADEELMTHAQWVRDAVEEMRTFLSELLRKEVHPDAEFHPQRLHQDLPAIFSCAERVIPPAERIDVFDDDASLDDYEAQKRDGVHGELPWSKALDWRSILNGLLLWHLQTCGAPPPDLGRDRDAAKERADNRGLAARLAVGGIELSEFHLRASRLMREVAAMTPVKSEGPGK